jgi:hypothetical protein
MAMYLHTSYNSLEFVSVQLLKFMFDRIQSGADKEEKNINRTNISKTPLFPLVIRSK